ncbi:MAG TPA: hypothetical protein ENF37_09735 [Beggiatoa sp.]|nr:hypothetical protein [Beggiatoa sp.]
MCSSRATPSRTPCQIRANSTNHQGGKYPFNIDAIKQGQGCGNQGLEKAIPDKWGDADFYFACQVHDKCYATCGYTQKFCDKRFLGDLIEECGKMIPVTQPLCGAVALSYYLSVDGFGEKSWKKGQEECI